MNFMKTIINSIKFWVNKKLEKKVDIEEGKMLSSNDYTTEEKEKLASIEAGATKTSVNGMTGDVVIEIPTLDSLGAQPAGDYALKTDILSLRDEFILNSSTDGSEKQFRITVDDNGTLTVAEVV